MTYSLSETLCKRFLGDGWLLLCAILEHRSEAAEFSLQRQSRSPKREGKTRKLTPPINFLPCKSVSKVIGQGKTRKILQSVPMAFAILNGFLSPITYNIAIRLDFDGVCHVILMRPDYERSNRGRPPLLELVATWPSGEWCSICSKRPGTNHGSYRERFAIWNLHSHHLIAWSCRLSPVLKSWGYTSSILTLKLGYTSLGKDLGIFVCH